jgi:ataxin-10
MVEPSIWPDLQKLWHTVADAQLSSRHSWDGDEESLQMFSVNLAKFTRNLVAGVPYNQDKV